jgi:hypothetical protein
MKVNEKLATQFIILRKKGEISSCDLATIELVEIALIEA